MNTRALCANGNGAPAQQAVTLPPAVVGPVSEGAALISMIERAARDPAVDVDKLTRLIALRNEARAQEEEREFGVAMTMAQTEMRPVAQDSSNPQTKSRYASYVALDRAVRPVYTKHGFGLSFDQGDGAPELHVRVLCYVSHASGHRRTYHIDMPADGKGAKGGDVMTRTHATGSAVSYGRRYLLGMIFNLAVGADDDGNAAGGACEYVTEAQIAELRKALKSVGKDEKRFCAWAKVGSLAEIYSNRLEAALAAIRRPVAK